jgi:hypothetical protein
MNVGLFDENGLSVSKTLSITTAGDALDYRRIDATTSEVEHTLDTAIGNAGQAIIVNRDETNFVDVGFATAVYPLRLLAGQADKLSLTPATASLFLKADTATCEVDIYIREV